MSTKSASQKHTKEFLQTFQEIKQLLNRPEGKTVINEIKDADIAMFIGNTKSGKSTLVNYAIGNQLKAVRKNVIPFSFSIAKVNDADEGPVIGLEAVSETTLPTVWVGKKSGLIEKVVDAPGFEDNRGEVQDIANSFYIREIIRNARSIKFILISDISDITSDNINPFTNFIEKINKIFPAPGVLEGGIVLVFSKGPGYITSQHICDIFKSSILNQDRLKMSNKSLIKYFVNNPGAITFFSLPQIEGNVNEQNIGSSLTVVRNQIIGISCNELDNVKPGISDKSRVLLLQLHTEFCNIGEFLPILERVHNSFKANCEMVHDMDSVDELLKLDETLQYQQEKISVLLPPGAAELSINTLLQLLVDLGLMCGINNITDNNMNLKLQFVEFLDDTFGLKISSIFKEKFLGTLEMIKNDFHLARLRSATKLNKITAEQAEKEKLELEQKHIEEMKKYMDKIAETEKENTKKVEKQLAEMGAVEHLVEAAKKIGNTVKSWFSWN